MKYIDWAEVVTTPKNISIPKSNCRNCGAPVTSERCDYCGTAYADYKLNNSDRLSYDFSDYTVLYADDTPFAVVHDRYPRNRHDDSIMALLTAAEIRQIWDGRKP